MKNAPILGQQRASGGRGIFIGDTESMRSEATEIYSDATNQVVMRHPGRRFPGVLVQGDTLYSMCSTADRACASAKSVLNENDFEDFNGLRNHLWSLLNHYKSVLQEHGIELPFSEI